MTERYLIASGNVSNPDNWFGGNKPAAGDTAHPNGFIGEVDESLTADLFTNVAGASAVAGGDFHLLGGNTLTGDVQSGPAPVVRYLGSVESQIIGNITAGASTAVVHDNAATGRLVIDGDVTGGTSPASRGITFQPNSPTASLLITGTLRGGTGADSSQGLLISQSPVGDNRLVTVIGDVIAGIGHGINFNGRAHVIVGGNLVGGPLTTSRGINQTGNLAERDGQKLTVFGSVFASDNGLGYGYVNNAGHVNDVTIYGSVVGRNASGMWLASASAAKITIRGGVNGGKAVGILNDSAGAELDVRADAVGGSSASAHGIRNNSTGSIRLGGLSVTSPSGALGISNPGGGDVTTEYLAEMEPAYLPDVRAAEGGKVLVTLLKNSVNASTLVTGTPTVEVFDFESNSVFGEPKPLTLEDGVYSYQHPTNVMTPRKLYYARVEAVIDDEARDLMERPFVAQ